MKVYKKVVIDIISGETVYEDSYEYDGPIDECKSPSQENRTFRSQQGTSFGGIGATSGSMNSFYASLEDMMRQRFGGQSQTFRMMRGYIQEASRSGPGNYDPRFDRAGGPGGGGTGTGGGGRGDGSGRGDRNNIDYPWVNNPTEQGSDLTGDLSLYGYDPSIYNVKLGPSQDFLEGEEEAMRTDVSETTAQQFANASQALGARSQQLGDFSPGLLASGNANLLSQAAATEAAGQRGVSTYGATQEREDIRQLNELKTQLAMAKAQGLSTAATARLEDAIAYREEAIKREGIKAGLIAAKMQARAAGAGARASERMQAAALAEERRQFNQRMILEGQQLRSQNFFGGLGALGQMGGMQDPVGLGGLGVGTLGNLGSLWGGAYGTGSQGMTSTMRQPFNWGSLAGAALGGAATIFSGGLGAPLFAGSALSGAGRIASGATG